MTFVICNAQMKYWTERYKFSDQNPGSPQGPSSISIGSPLWLSIGDWTFWGTQNMSFPDYKSPKTHQKRNLQKIMKNLLQMTRSWGDRIFWSSWSKSGIKQLSIMVSRIMVHELWSQGSEHLYFVFIIVLSVTKFLRLLPTRKWHL